MSEPAAHSPAVSIIIPCYNAERWVGETIESAVGQTFKDLEIIVVDDGSTDGSREVAGRYTARGVRVVRQANGGPSAARNRGLAESSGAFVQYLDADDLLEPTKIEAQLRCLQQSGSDVFVRGPWAHFFDRITGDERHQGYFEHDMAPIDALIYKACPQMFIHPASALFPRKLLDRVGPWNPDLRMNEDGEYFGRVIAASSRVLWCGNGFAYYRQHQTGSLSREGSRRQFESYSRSLELEDALLLGLEDSERVRKALGFRWSAAAYAMWPRFPDLSRSAEKRARGYGAFTVMHDGHPRWKAVARVVGWRTIKSLRELRRKLRSSRAKNSR